MNRMARWQLLSLVLALAGIGVAGYLTTAHYRQEILVCGVGDCQTVQNSPYAEIGGVPIALLGAGMYVTLVAVGLARWRWPERHELLTAGAFAIALAGTLYAAYLTYLEIWVIRAICQWCVVSALLTLGILLVESFGLSRLLSPETDQALSRSQSQPGRREAASERGLSRR
ncbi:vitamin K epoxide reductase family protein [Thermomicrobiaceae bacterium CFH 74404]|uniref:Vitamin K epoxide reductase family protein n=3 Tax=Thermomicrobia TaxID=189775 RepID=A0AA41W9Q5_9BACT|nr:vitamin K epoxide reductase family protein [Thermalbibacter longus]MCM8747912.1 vitamin K epoxide reductase family protein [Thermalbibacter longus]